MSNALEEIQTLAKFYDLQLRKKFGSDAVAAGGNLFLGKYYAASDKIFFGLNPGTYKAGNRNPFIVELRRDNGPWGHRSSQFPYWRNCTFFFDSSTRLSSWIADATSTFLIPWRSCNLAELRRQRNLAEQIYKYSGSLICKIIEHHCAKTLIVAGVESLRILALPDFLNFPLNDRTIAYHFDGTSSYSGPRGIYQWRKVVRQELVVYQVPHFARASNRKALADCALWLEQNILSREARER